jgi:hypothetical protein
MRRRLPCGKARFLQIDDVRRIFVFVDKLVDRQLQMILANYMHNLTPLRYFLYEGP